MSLWLVFEQAQQTNSLPHQWVNVRTMQHATHNDVDACVSLFCE